MECSLGNRAGLGYFGSNESTISLPELKKPFLYFPAHGLVIIRLHYSGVGVIDSSGLSERLRSQLAIKFAEHQKQILRITYSYMGKI
jgi:hypothetical protein